MHPSFSSWIPSWRNHQKHELFVILSQIIRKYITISFWLLGSMTYEYQHSSHRSLFWTSTKFFVVDNSLLLAWRNHTVWTRNCDTIDNSGIFCSLNEAFDIAQIMSTRTPSLHHKTTIHSRKKPLIWPEPMFLCCDSVTFSNVTESRVQ